jgi:hypothetical protein
MGMKSRKTRLAIATAIALILGAAVFVELRRAAHEARTRAAVYYWIRSMDWWNHSQTEAANERRQAAGLRSVGAGAVTTLERDLHYHSPLFRWSERIPLLQRFFPQPGLTDEPQEVRQRAVHFLAVLGPDARSAVPALLDLVSDSDSRVRFEVAFVLGRIGVDVPEVRAALTNMLADSRRYVRFSAAISLWSFDRTNAAAIERVEKLISLKDLSWPSICLMKFGADAKIFAPRLKQAIDGAPWSYYRIQAVHALWLMTRDKQFVLEELASVAKALEKPGGARPASGWTDAEEVVGYVVSKLDDEKEFRDRARPMLQTILADAHSSAHSMARVYLRRFDELDKR